MSIANDLQQEEQRDITSERIVALLWRKRMRQVDLATAIGIAQPNLSAKLRGARRWYLFEIVGIASALGTSASYLIGETDDDAALRPAGVEGNEEWARWGSNPRPAD